MVTQKKYLVPTWWEQESFSEFKTEYSKPDNRLLFFIGSGISRWMNLPDWKGLLLSLANYYESNTDKSIKAEVDKLLGDVKNNPSKYQELGTIIKNEFDSLDDSTLWRKALNDILNNQSIIDTPSQIHNVIAQLKWFRIVTPNYDQLIELAMNRLKPKKEFEVTHPWKHIDNANFIEQCKKPCIFKIHGDITDTQSKIILAEEDYNELYAKPKENEPPNTFQRTLGSVLRSADTILFMGYSHDDPYLKDLYEYELIKTNRDKIFALVERSGKDFEDKINTLSKDLEIKFISYSSGENHSELLDFLNYFVDPEATEERYRRLVNIKKPTVIMLHCGGTIWSEPNTAKENSLSVVKIESRYDQKLTKFSEQLLSWYNNSYNSGNDLDIEIIWEILPKEFQMLSENATPLLWNEMRKKIESIIFKYFEAPEISENKPHLSNEKVKKLFEEENDQYSIAAENNVDGLSYKRFSSEFKNRYILGIVILFGTDTLAYLAPALSFSLQHLPCPIVITGANQSPKEKDKIKETELFATSDTWKNLKMSLYFLQCFGHRTREIFVCFGNTVHNCVNLRKRAMEIVPTGSPLLSDPFLEPFTYRNVSPHYQYMFKFIDGIFCNNYYTDTYHGLLTGDDVIRHIRHDALEAMPTNKTIGDDFHPVVQHVLVTPSFPLIDVKGMLSTGKRRDKLRAFLVEGYPSGTYPTFSENNFSNLLIELYKKGIPIILVSRYGILATQQEYETNPLPDNIVVPILRLYGIIAETALPLISMVIGQISDNEWKMTGTSGTILASRTKLVKRKLAEFFRLRPNIISEELKYVIEEGKMNTQLKHHYSELARVDINRINVIGMPKVNFPFLHLRKHQDEFSKFVTMSRDDFKLLLNEFVRPFEKVGAGPDGFEILYNLGFDIGISIFNSFKPRKKPRGNILFSDRKPDDQAVMQEEVNDKLEKVSLLLRQSNIADIEIITKMSVGSPPNDLTIDTTYANSFSFEIAVHRHGAEERDGEKYSVMTFTEAESEFFKKLQSGFDKAKDTNTFIKGLKEDYKKLLTGTWENSSQAVDWLILGIYKSIACEIAHYLRFDAMAVTTLDIGSLHYLRQAVKVNINQGDKSTFIVQFVYFESPSLDVTD